MRDIHARYRRYVFKLDKSGLCLARRDYFLMSTLRSHLPAFMRRHLEHTRPRSRAWGHGRPGARWVLRAKSSSSNATCWRAQAATARKEHGMILRLAFYIVMTFASLPIIRGQADVQAVAVFDFELIDTSLEGAINGLRADEQARLGRLSGQLRQRLAESGRFSLVDITPIASEARASNLQACGGCDTRLAKHVGAAFAITGTVQKVSNLILNMSIYIRDVPSGRTIAAMSADMRGNTDESWSRTLDWLIRNRLLAPGHGARQ
jgi:Protein of unknown function (DUF2380)